MKIRPCLCVLVAVVMSAVVRAEVKLPRLTGSGMVLQRDVANEIRGWADPGEAVTVRIGEETHTEAADAEGRWSVTLAARGAGGPHTITIAGTNTIELTDVLFGEVWVCSGQSNMEWPLRLTDHGAEDVAGAGDTQLRLFKVERRVSTVALEDVSGGQWAAASPESVADFTAVGYHFGLRLREELEVPVGLIQSAWGGTPAEAWATRGALEAGSDSIAKLLTRWDLAADPANVSPHQPAALYNAMIHPIRRTSVAGAIWYQGESNADRAEQYRELFPLMIESWRDAFGRRDLPFGFVQLASFMARAEAPGESAWAELRDAQRSALGLSDTGMAVAIDIGEANDIHPRNKRDVGARLARWALHDVYGKDSVTPSGPVPVGHEIKGDAIVISFEHADGLRTTDGAGPRSFAIAGEDRVFHWAEARIEGATVVVHTAAVSRPTAVRYAWADNPAVNLVNGAGLPATPFRTDRWKGITSGRATP
ncbi:MAG: hypothetical protein KDA21_08130 [Phycisphaerales bacterium]|nr:hypothetical protein [Phycisphaerales bacterium]